MSEKTAKQKRKKEFGLCEECNSQICPCVIKHVRQQENAMVVAKQAITSLDAMLKKATMERNDFMERNEELTDRLKGKTQGIINDRMKEIDKQVSRFSLRKNIGVN